MKIYHIIKYIFIRKILVYLYFGEKTSIRAMGCCGVITVGFLLGVQEENSMSNF